MGLMPLLAVALIIWAGVFAFIWGVDNRVRVLEAKVNALPAGDDTTSVEAAR